MKSFRVGIICALITYKMQNREEKDEKNEKDIPD